MSIWNNIFYPIFISLLISIGYNFEINLHNSQAILEVKSEKQSTQFQVFISIKSAQGKQFTIQSQALSPQSQKHKVRLSQGQIHLEPEIQKQKIIIRDYENQTYYFAFKHDVQSKPVNFIPIRITQQGLQYDLFLPAFDMALISMPQKSIYRCDQVLISIQHRDNQEGEKDDELQVVLFTKDKIQHNFYFNVFWDQKWRHYDDGVYFGGAKKTGNIHEKMIIHLGTSQACVININELPQPGNVVDLQAYYEIADLLQWAPALPLELVNDEL